MNDDMGGKMNGGISHEINDEVDSNVINEVKDQVDEGMGTVEMVQVREGRAFLKIQRLDELRKDFGFFGVLCILYGMMGSFCLYRNPLGIAVPLFVVISYGSMFLVLKRMKTAVKRGSLFLAAAAVLIGLSACFTTDMFIGYYMNRIALSLLFCIFMLHQFHQDENWNIGKYAASIIIYLAEAVGMIFCPFTHLAHYVKSIESKRYKTALTVFAGICAAVPAMIFLSLLLASADMVFQNFLNLATVKLLNPVPVFSRIIQAAAWAVLLYCLVCSAIGGRINDDAADKGVHSPVAVISFMSMIGFIYLAFCSIQVVYLFMGKGSLPWGMTYSDYARQGFFQLLFVAVLNLAMVLLSIKYCKENAVLKGVLLVISLCTYVMIASAAYRMILYVQQYHLTFLRVLVLWFLAMLSVLMVGVVILIFKRRFPLFGFCVGVVSMFYLGLAWMRPDYVIAKYNVEHGAAWEADGMSYLSCLSGDAAPVIRNLPDSYRRELLVIYIKKYDEAARGSGPRTFNFSAWEMWKIFTEQGGS